MTTITTDEADEILWGDPVARQDVSDHRWYTKQLIVYKDGDILRGFYYMDPATEDQEGQDTYETDPVETFPVIGVERTITVYERDITTFEKG